MSQISLNRRKDYIPDVNEMLPHREYRCEFNCRKTFKNRTPYDKHLLKAHGIERQDNSYNSYRCPLGECEYVGVRLDLVRRHYQNNHMEKNYKCDECGRKFIVESQFIKHRCDIQHYNCPKCSKTFRHLNMRNKHVRECIKRNSRNTAEKSKIEELSSFADDEHYTLQTDSTGVPEPIIVVDELVLLPQNEFVDFNQNQYTYSDMAQASDSRLYDSEFVNEFEQLLQNIENKTIEDPDLIEALIALTPVLQSLQSEIE